MNQLTAFVKTRRTLVFFLLFMLPVFAGAQVTANFSMDKAGGCSPLSVSFSNQTSGASANAVYRWDFGNGNTSVLANPGAIFTDEKTYTITLTVTDGNKTSSKTATVTVYKKPTVDFSVVAPKVCIPAEAGFVANANPGDGSISSYAWDFGDGQTQQGYGNTINHYYNYQQKPTVNLTVTNSFGCYNTITRPGLLEILGKIEPVFTTDKNLLCSLNESLQFTNNSTGPGTLSYKWNFGDGTSSTQKNPVHQFTKKGVYPVSLTVSNADGCTATSYPASVNAAYFNTDFNSRPLCRELNFTGTSYLSPDNSFWQFGDGSSTYAYYNTTHVYPAAGNYDVTLVNTYGVCKDTVSKTVRVEDLVNFNSSIETPAVMCKGNYYTFKSRSNVAPGNSYWELGDGATGYWTEVNHGFQNAGTYTVKLTNTFGTCKETVTRQVVVNELPDLQGFVVDYGGVCGAPVNIKFKDTTAGAVKWQWRLDTWSGNYFSTQQNAAYNFAYDGYYWVDLTVTNAAGCSRNFSRPVNVFKPSVSLFLLSSSSQRGYYDCDSLKVKMGTSANQTIASYKWNFGDNTTSTEEAPEHTYKKEGSYNITLNYTTESGCTGVATFFVRVYGKAKADFAYTIPCGNSLDLQFTDRSYFSDNWEWNFGDNGYNGYGPNPYHTYSDTGKYNVQFISHIGHCSDTITKQVYANVLPSSVAIIKAETTCEGNRGSVTFDQRSLRISSGTWNFGDGTTVPYDTSAHSVKHTYTRTGIYQVTLTGRSGNCTLTSSQAVHILLKQKPVLTANKTEICANDNLNVTLAGMEVNPYTGNWQLGQYYVTKFEHNNGSVYNGNQNSYFNQYTSYTATLQNFNAGTTSMRAIISSGWNGCADTSNYISLKVNGPIAGFKVAADNICYKSAFVFEDTSRTSTNTPLKTWQWDFGDGEYATHTSPVKVKHLYKSPGSYTVRLTVSDASGCQSSFFQTVNAKGPKASFTASGLYVPNVPLNTTVTFYNNTISWYSNSVDYTWHYGDGAMSADYWGQHTYTKAGVNTVKLIANDPSISCADTAIQVINVKDFNTAFSFTTNYLTNSSCPPVVVRINNLSVGYTRLVWDFGDGTTSNDQPYPSHVYDKPGVYKITLYTYGYNGLTGTYRDSVTISQPSAKLSADVLKGCTSQQVKLSANATNTRNYAWDFGDGTLVNNTANASSHRYLTPGVYQPKLIVEDANGCAATVTLADKIVIDSLAIAIKGIPAQICDSTRIFFTPEVTSIAEQAGVPLLYHWDFGTGNPADTSNIKNAVFNFNKPGNYIVRFKAVSPYGCIKEVSEQVRVYKKSIAGINGPAGLCAGSSATFKGSASMLPVEWAWNFSNGNTGNTQNPGSQLFSQAATYNVQLIVKYNGCSDTVIHPLVVHPNPLTNVSVTKPLVCRGESVQLNASGGETYKWKPGTGLNDPALASPLASPLQTTNYLVDVTNSFGCTKTDSVLLTVVQPFNLASTKDTFVCKGSSVQLTASGADTYLWINNTSGLNNTRVAAPSASPLVNTVYTVVGSDAYNCFKDTATVNVVVRSLPTVTAEPDFQMLAAETHQLKATASADVVQWIWSPVDFLSCTTCPSPVTQPRQPMDYVVTVKNQYGCAASDTVSVKLDCAENFVFIPNGFTPNNDGNNDVFYIMGKGIGIINSMVIYNRWGEPVFERRNFSIDDRASGWDGKNKGLLVPAGVYVYFAEMQCANGQPIIKKGTVTVVY